MNATLFQGAVIQIPTDFIGGKIDRQRADLIEKELISYGQQVKRLEGANTTYLEIW